MNDIDMNNEWALSFEFMTQTYEGDVALVSNDWKKLPFTYKITHIPGKNLVVAYFRMTDDTIAELIVMGVVRGTYMIDKVVIYCMMYV